MRTEIRVLAFSSAFVSGLALIYWFTSYEDAGTTLLAVTALAYAMLCAYLYLVARPLRSGGERSSDSTDPPAMGGGGEEIGYFPSSSVWPPALAMGAVLTSLGLVFGYWFFVIAAIFFVGAIVGYAVEASAPH